MVQNGKATSTFASITQKAGTALKSFGAALASMGVNMAIGIGIEALISLFNNVANSAEHAKESSQNFINSVTSAQSEFAEGSSKIEELDQKYQKLSKGVNEVGENVSLTNTQYDEYKSVIKQITDLMPNLTTQINSQGEAIGFVGGKLDSVAAKYRKYRQTQAAKFITEGDDEGKTYGDVVEAYNKSEQTEKGEKNFFERWIGGLTGGLTHDPKKEFSDHEAANLLDEMSKLSSKEDVLNFYTSKSAQYSSFDDLVGYTWGEISAMDDANFQKFREIMAKKSQGYITTIEQTAKNTGKAMSEYAISTDGFWTMNDDEDTNEKMQTYVTTFLSGIDRDFINENKLFTVEEQQIFVDNFISSLSKNKGNISDAFKDLFALNIEDMNIDDAREKIQKFCTIIANQLHISLPTAQRLIGFGNFFDTASNYDKTVAYASNGNYKSAKNVKDSRGFNQSDVLKAMDENSINTEEEINKFKECLNAAVSLEEAVRRYTGASAEAANTTKSFSKAWKAIGTSGDEDADKKAKEAKDKLLELAEAGKLTKKEFESSSISDSFLKQTGLDAEEATRKINELVEETKQLSALRTGITTITSAYDEKKDSKKKVVSSSTLDSMGDTLGVADWKGKDLEVWENYKNIAADGTKGTKELKEAQDSLATSFVNNGNYLANLTSEKKEYYKSLLEEMGVTNASQIIQQQLIINEDKLTTKKINAKLATLELKSATVNEATALGNELAGLYGSSEALGLYVLKKQLANKNALKTSDSIENLIALAKQCGLTGKAITWLGYLQANQAKLENLKEKGGGNGAEWDNTLKEIDHYQKLVTKAANKKVKIKPTTTYGNKTNPSGKSDGGKDKSKSNSKQEIDWIERRVNRLTSIISRLNAEKENLFSVKKKNSNLKKQIKETTKLIKTYSSAIKKYSKKADSIKLSAPLKKLVENGKIKGGYKKLVKKYGEKTANKIQSYQNWYDKSESAKQSLAEAKKQKRELKKEKYQNSVDLFNARVSRAETKESIGIGYKDKNKSVDTQIRNAKKSYGYQIKIAKKLEKNKAEWQKLEYEREKKIAELRLQQINNIQQDYENRIGLTENERENLDNAISLAEAKGKIITAGYYKKQNDYTNDKRAKAVEEKRQIQISLDQALKTKEIKEGSDEWYEIQSKLHTLDNTINECDVTIANNTRAIREVHVAMLNEMAENKNRINTEADFIASLSHKEKTDSDTGTLTDTGYGYLGSYAINMSSAQEQIKIIKKERAILEDMKKKGILDFGDGGAHKYDSLEDFEEYYNKLVQDQQEWTKTAFQAEQNIIDLMKEYYQAQLDYMKDIIDAKKKALDLEKDLYDYQKNIAEKTKNIALLEKQAAAIKGDTSEEGRARLSKIQLSLDEANQDLQDTEYNRYISDQQNMLDNMYFEYEDLMQRLFKDTDALLKDGITAINENGSLIKNIMDKTAKDYNYNYSDNFSDIVTAFGKNTPIVTAIKDSLNCNESSIASVLSRQDKNIAAIYKDVGTIANGSGSGNKPGNNGNNNGNKDFIINKDDIYSSTITDQYGHKINSDGIGEFGKTLQKISPYLNAVKGSPKSALNKLLKKKTGSYISDKNKNADLKSISKALGVKYDGKYTKGGAVYKYLKAHGFQTGGIVRANNVPPTGDYVPVRVNPNETILTQKFTDMLPQTVDVMDNLQKAIRVPDYTRQIVKNDAGVSYGDIHFDIDLPNVTNSSTAKDIIHALQNDTKVQQVFSEGVNNLMKQRRITGRTRSIR